MKQLEMFSFLAAFVFIWLSFDKKIEKRLTGWGTNRVFPCFPLPIFFKSG